MVASFPYYILQLKSPSLDSRQKPQGQGEHGCSPHQMPAFLPSPYSFLCQHNGDCKKGQGARKEAAATRTDECVLAHDNVLLPKVLQITGTLYKVEDTG